MKALAVVALSGFLLVAVSCSAPKKSNGLTLRPTMYYKPIIDLTVSKCDEAAKNTLFSPEDDVLNTLCSEDYGKCLMQGSCLVKEVNKVTSYNFHSITEGRARFFIGDLSVCPYGYGVKGHCLDPYFSVAADLAVYKVGDVIFVPRLLGAVLPNSEVHDGYLIVRDAGGGVRGADRFDFYTGFHDYRERKNTLGQLGFSDPKNGFNFRVASAEEKMAVHARRNFPGLTESVLSEGQRAAGAAIVSR